MLEPEPRRIGRILRLIRAHVRIAAVAVEVAAVVAHVREHAVEHHANAHRARVPAQARKVLLRAEHRVDLPVVARVVLVVGARPEDRVEVEHRHAQVAQVRQLLTHALQIAAEKVARQPVAVVRDGAVGALIPVRMHAHVVALSQQAAVRHAVVKAVDHDLVHHALAHPARRVIGGIAHRDLIGVRIALQAHAAQVVRRVAVQDGLLPLLYAKAVPHQARMIACLDLRLVQISALLRAQHAHRVAGLGPVPRAHEDEVGRLIRLHAQADAHALAAAHGAKRPAIERIPAVVIQSHRTDSSDRAECPVITNHDNFRGAP